MLVTNIMEDLLQLNKVWKTAQHYIMLSIQALDIHSKKYESNNNVPISAK
jgi:hypothetical protein